jgi:hypothetical protein
MHVPAKRTLAIGAAVVAAAGGGAAVAATTNGSPPNDFLDSVAKHLGISRQKLDDATKAAALDQVDAQLKAGRITQAQADELKQRIQNGDIPPLAFGRGGFGPGVQAVPGGPGVLKAGIGDALSAAAKYLGLSESDLRAKLGNGQSLADIAKARGKDAAGLQQAILDSAKADLDKTVSDKKITQAQADDIYNGLKARIADIVNGNLRFRGPDRPGKALFGDALGAAAKYLGLSESDLQTKLGNGQSLADIAKAQGKSTSGLEDAIVAAQQSALDQAVKDKRLTQAQADKILSELKAHADDLVNGKPGAGPRFRGRFHGGGPGFFFGP